VFAWLFLGGAAAAALAMLFFSVTPNPPLSGSQALTLLYLGLLASGIGFFLWNIGSSRVSAGTLAVMNNLKIPLAVGVSLLVFHERADLARLAVGGSAILLALWLNSRRKANEIVSGR
jgi:drug/metabolite transporter (DMT)-like permease